LISFSIILQIRELESNQSQMPTSSQDQNKQPTDNETATNANTNKTPTDNGDHRTSQEAFIYLCETQHIRILDEPVQRHNSGYQL